MTKKSRIIIILALICAAAVVFAVKNRTHKQRDVSTQPVAESAPKAEHTPAAEQTAKLPRLIDLGADKCVPCKMMAPILEELSETQSGYFHVMFYDVWKQKEYAQLYGIRSIPTQIFLDPEGKELYRHEGFFSKEEILKTWKRLGYPTAAAK